MNEYRDFVVQNILFIVNIIRNTLENFQIFYPQSLSLFFK